MRVLLGVVLVLMAVPAAVGGLLFLDTLFGLAHGLATILFDDARVWLTNVRQPGSVKYPEASFPAIRS